MSPSTSKTLRSCSSINHSSWHIDDILQAASVKSNINQVEYYIEPEDVDDVSRDRSIDASQDGSLDDFYWFIEELPPTKLPGASPFVALCSSKRQGSFHLTTFLLTFSCLETGPLGESIAGAACWPLCWSSATGLFLLWRMDEANHPKAPVQILPRAFVVPVSQVVPDCQIFDVPLACCAVLAVLAHVLLPSLLPPASLCGSYSFLGSPQAPPTPLLGLRCSCSAVPLALLRGRPRDRLLNAVEPSCTLSLVLQGTSEPSCAARSLQHWTWRLYCCIAGTGHEHVLMDPTWHLLDHMIGPIFYTW